VPCCVVQDNHWCFGNDRRAVHYLLSLPSCLAPKNTLDLFITSLGLRFDIRKVKRMMPPALRKSLEMGYLDVAESLKCALENEQFAKALMSGRPELEGLVKRLESDEEPLKGLPMFIIGRRNFEFLYNTVSLFWEASCVLSEMQERGNEIKELERRLESRLSAV